MTAGFEGVVVHPACRGIEILHEDAEAVTLEVNAAETWDDVVQYAVERNWWGIENLSHIPGQAGAALVQNIGAYGQQASDVVQSARVMEISTGAPHVLSAADCGFGYRRSIFNTTARGKLIIVGLTLRLAKHGRPQLDYPDVQAYFQERGIKQPSLAEIRQAIISIRDRKFPFPREERGGNAGSFFKNLSLRESRIRGAARDAAAQLFAAGVGAAGRDTKSFPLRGPDQDSHGFLDRNLRPQGASHRGRAGE